MRAIGGHHSAKPKTEEWLTPPEVIAALGGAESFDLDPCAPAVQPWPTARAVFTRSDNGLLKPWHGRVWLNPPYSTGVIERWLARLAEHGKGTSLIFARTETEAFFRHVWERAHALLFIRGRLHFHLPDGRRAAANAGAPSVLCAYGKGDAETLAYCGIGGQFVPIVIERAFLVQLPEPTWREAIRAFFDEHPGGPVTLADLYRAFGDHPKAERNPNYRAKIRQQLQLGSFERVGRGQWRVA